MEFNEIICINTSSKSVAFLVFFAICYFSNKQIVDPS